MGYHPRIESEKYASFQTTRCAESRLWFANNSKLEQAILGYTAKFADRYNVKLYAFAIEGNHIQIPAHFPKENRASFMRDLNSCVARAVPRCTPTHGGGRLWERRYSNEFLLGNDDIENQFFYTVLQPVQDGLVKRLSEYPFYNCFHDAIYGIIRRYKVINWGKYNAALKRRQNVSIKDFADIVELKYERLPGYEHLSQKEYAALMLRKLEARRIEIVRQRIAEGLGFAGREILLQTEPGSFPRSTKRSTINSHRPRILSVCPVRRAEGKAWYFGNYFRYKEASREYRSGKLDVKFPPGMYPPSRPCAG